MKLLYYDHVLYTRWYGQEVYKLYIFKKKKKVCLFGSKKMMKKKPTIHSKSPRSHFFFQISTAKMYLYRSLLIAKNCMIDGRMHELCLSNCGSTIIQLHHLKEKKTKERKPLLSSAPRLPVRPCSELVVSFAGFLKSTLALTSSLRRRLSASVRDVQVVLARLWMWARTSRASFLDFISTVGLKSSLERHFAPSDLSLNCNDSVVGNVSSLSKQGLCHTPSSVLHWFKGILVY